jgi:transcriptional regulator
VYTPRPFAVDDRPALIQFIRDYGFASLVTVEDGAPVATHLPLQLESAGGGDVLLGHLARANPQWKGFDSGAMAVFSGPHAYVSPNWYRAPETSVPTWNYAAVHAYGTPEVIEDGKQARRVMERLVEQYEGASENPWTLDGTQEGFIEKMLQGIVTFRMPVERLEGKFKLSQNRPSGDRRAVAAGLRASGRAGDREMAAMMEGRED